MRLAVVFYALAASCAAANADQFQLHADLVCSSSGQVALVRFALGWNDDQTVYAALPPAVDRALSKLPRTDRTDCRLPGGRTVRIRDGEEQAFAYGAGGGDPPAFFSLWIDRRKVLSRFVWKPGYENAFAHQPLLVGVVIGPATLAFCYQAEGTKAVTCKRRHFDLNSYAIDAEEYPADPASKMPAGTLLVDAASSDPSFCQRRVESAKSDAGDQWQGLLSQNSVHVEDPQPDSSAAAGNGYHVDSLAGTFSNVPDGRVTVLSGGNHYFDGEIVVVAPKAVSPQDVISHFPSDDLDKEAAAPPPAGWTIIAGGRPSLYPGVSARYVHFEPQQIGGELYLLAHPTNQNERPSAVLLKPLPGGGFTAVCVFNQVAPHF